MPVRYSIVTTCKGRLDHLRRTLPRFLSQPDAEVIVVDYACPDNTAALIAREFPRCRVVVAGDVQGFNLAHARNLGAEAARGEWLVFIDADVVMAEDFVPRLEKFLTVGEFYGFPSVSPERHGIYGSCVIRRSDFQSVQGYDAAMQGYGGEDEELYARMRLIRAKRVALPEDLIERVIQHGDVERTVFHDRKAIADNLRINAAYRLVKNTVLRQLEATELPESTRKLLYQMVVGRIAEALKAEKTTVHIAVPLPDDQLFAPLREWDCRRHVVFELKVRELDVDPAGLDKG